MEKVNKGKMVILIEGENKGNTKPQNNIDKSKVMPPPPPLPKKKN